MKLSNHDQVRGDLGERGIEQREIWQEHRTHQHKHGACQQHPAPAAEPHDAWLAVLAADDGISAPAEHHVLRAQQYYRKNKKRERSGRSKLRLGWKLEQAPDLGRHRVEARRHRQDRRRAEQRHRLQECDQRAREHRRKRERNRDTAGGVPGLAAENGGRIFQIAGDTVERIGNQHEDIGKRVAGDDEHQACEAVNVEQMKIRPAPVSSR